MKEDLSKKNKNFEYINILESMSNLKDYLEFRDNMEEFKSYKENRKLGIPLIVIEENDEFKVLIESHNANLI